MAIRRSTWIVWLLLVALLLAVFWWFVSATRGPSYQIESVVLGRGDLKSGISASGTVTPQGSVSVGSQVSGQVSEVLVDYNDQVKTGQVLARLDPSTHDQRVRQAVADLDAARAQVQVQISQAGARRADISRAQVNLAAARRDMARKQDLIERGFISSAEREAAQTVFMTRTEDLKSAQAANRVVGAQIDNARAIVAQREAALANTRVDLDRTTIRSPIDGIVIKRSIDAGQTVAASLQAPEMFVIARNLTDMRVEASVDESDIGRIAEGMPASFSVDAFASKTFLGRVDQIRVSAEDAESVITYTVLIGFRNDGARLLPGMTANVLITTADRPNVLRIPNAALRVRAPSDLLVADNESEATAKPAEQATEQRGGRMRRLRQQLIDAVKPDEQQQVALDAVFKRAGSSFRGLSAVPAKQRKARVKAIRAQMRQQIAAVLRPEQVQQWRLARAGGDSSPARAYKVISEKLEAVDFQTGISDGNFTEVIRGLSEGESVALSVKRTAGGAGDGSLRLLRLFR